MRSPPTERGIFALSSEHARLNEDCTSQREYMMTCPKTCAAAPNIRITQELLDKDSLSYGEANEYRERLGSVRITKGKHVALIFAKRADESRPTPYLKCACDFHFEEREHARMHYIDTYKCSRKEAWYKKRTKEVAAEYNDKGLSPREIILDIFDRAVCKGEFLGQRNGDWIYVQHIGEIFAMLVMAQSPIGDESAG